MKKTFFVRSILVALIGFGAFGLEAAVLKFGNNGAADESPLYMSGDITPHYAAEVGGVAFMNTAQPATALNGLTVSVQYRPNAVDGRRFVAVIGDQNAVIRAPDWLVVPAIRFADSDYTAAYTLLHGTRIHPALQKTEMGVIAAYVDNMLEHPLSLKDEVSLSGNTDDTPFIPPSNDIARERAAWQITSVWLTNDWDGYIYTDEKVQEVFSVQNGQLQISGHPYVWVWSGTDEIWDDQTHQNRIVGLKTVRPATSFFVNNPRVLIDLNPAVFATAEQFSHFVSFFRYLKTNNPTEWHRLTQVTSSIFLPDPALEEVGAGRTGALDNSSVPLNDSSDRRALQLFLTRLHSQNRGAVSVP